MISSLQGKALRTLVDIPRLAEIKRILGECLLISSLPGKALRMLVDIARFDERFNIRSQSRASKLDIKRRKPGILFISLPQTSDIDVFFDVCVDSAS